MPIKFLRSRKKYVMDINRDDFNDAKLNQLFADLNRNDLRLILNSKNTGAWMNIWVNTVTGTLLAATKLCGFYACAVSHPLMYIMHLAAAKKSFPLHVTKKPLYKPSLKPLYADNPSSTRAASYQRGGVSQLSDRLETRGDVLVWVLWDRHIDRCHNRRQNQRL